MESEEIQINDLLLILSIETNLFRYMDGFNSSVAVAIYRLPQVSILGPFFIAYINYLHLAVKYSKVYHVADEIKF